MSNELTEHFGIPKPNPENDVAVDVIKLQEAFDILDAALFTLQQALAAKAASSHGHEISGIEGLADALAGKMAASKTFALADLTDVDGAAEAINNYVLTKIDGVFAFRAALSVLGEHSHATDSWLASLLASKAGLSSPAFTGTPTAPTAAPGTNSTQLATTAFVIAVRDALVNGAPGQLDTIEELAAALGDDENFAATITAALADLTAALAGKAALDPTGSSASTVTSPWAWNSNNIPEPGHHITAQAGNLTISADAGSPGNFKKRLLRITASGGARTITFTGGSAKSFLDCTGGWLTVSSSNWTYQIPNGKTADFGLIYDSTAQRWRIVGVAVSP